MLSLFVVLPFLSGRACRIFRACLQHSLTKRSSWNFDDTAFDFFYSCLLMLPALNSLRKDHIRVSRSEVSQLLR